MDSNQYSLRKVQCEWHALPEFIVARRQSYGQQGCVWQSIPWTELGRKKLSYVAVRV